MLESDEQLFVVPSQQTALAAREEEMVTESDEL